MKQNTRNHLVAFEPTEQEIPKGAAFWTLAMTGSFAMELDIARSVWKKYRALVEAPEFPEDLVLPLMDNGGHAPSEYKTQDQCMEQDFGEKMRQMAIKYLLKERCGWTSQDDHFLREMGIDESKAFQ